MAVPVPFLPRARGPRKLSGAAAKAMGHRVAGGAADGTAPRLVGRRGPRSVRPTRQLAFLCCRPTPSGVFRAADPPSGVSCAARACQPRRPAFPVPPARRVADRVPPTPPSGVSCAARAPQPRRLADFVRAVLRTRWSEGWPSSSGVHYPPLDEVDGQGRHKKRHWAARTLPNPPFGAEWRILYRRHRPAADHGSANP